MPKIICLTVSVFWSFFFDFLTMIKLAYLWMRFLSVYTDTFIYILIYEFVYIIFVLLME